MKILSKHEVEIEGKLLWQNYRDLAMEYNRQHWRVEQWQKDYEQLQSRLAAAEAECAIYYEIAAAAIGEEQTIALRDAAMRRRRGRDGTVTICTEILSSDVQHERTQ